MIQVPKEQYEDLLNCAMDFAIRPTVGGMSTFKDRLRLAIGRLSYERIEPWLSDSERDVLRRENEQKG